MSQPAASKIKCLAVAGPTASGKTACGVSLALRFGGEVISADSMQIYEGMDIGTAKPTPEETMGVPHHLMGFVPQGESFSVARYAQLCREKIEEVHARGRAPILVGGTGLYLSSVVDNIQFADVGSDEGLRRQLWEKSERQGYEALLCELRAFDPESAARLADGNVTRIIRAIEVYRLSGKTMTELNRQSRSVPCPYDFLLMGIAFHDRALLYDRIDRRVDRMLEQGLLEEAREVLRYPGGPTALQAIGYKELAPYFDGLCTLEEAARCIKRETRRYAKRQLTWFRRMEGIRWIYADGTLSVAEQAAALVRPFLEQEKGDGR